MELRRIGSLSVSVVGLGTNNFGARIDEKASKQVVEAALEAGINFFDTADIYGGGLSEEYLGRALGRRRAEVVIATKCGMARPGFAGGASAAYIRQAAESSLRRLRTDYIDLYQLHAPDPTVPIEETLGAFAELVASGKVREIGCSNFEASQLHHAYVAAGKGPRFVSVQNEYSLLCRRPETDGVLQACQRYQMAFLPYYPLARGLLSGKYRPGEPPPANSRLSKMSEDDRSRLMDEVTMRRVEELRAVAEQRGWALASMSIAWLATRPQVASVIAGATSPEQVRQNAEGAWLKLDESVLAELDRITVS